MAGYKQTVIDDDAAAFWTFDGDMVDSGSRTLLASPLTIIDEIDNQNPAILHVQSESGPHGYRMGMPSMIKLEMEDQASICFGYYGKQPAHPEDGYAKAYLEVPHSSTFQFPKFGSFTVEFMMRKETWETDFLSRFKNYYPRITRPIIRKAGVLNIYYLRPSGWYSKESFEFLFPSKKTASINFDDWVNRNIHVVVIWKVEEVERSVYRATEKIFFDARLMHSATTIYYDTFPTTNIASSWEIGGLIDGPSSSGDYVLYDDRNISPLYLDQIAVYDKALTEEQVINHYKKIYEYDDMIVNDRAADYFQMDESDSLVDWKINNSVDKQRSGEYIGNINLIRRGLPGPNNIPWSKAPYFEGYALAQFIKKDNYGWPRAWVQLDNDYTIEFWFNSQFSGKGVLFSLQENEMPFQGVRVTLNWVGNEYKSGAIEYRENVDLAIRTLEFDEDRRPYQFNDGKWHHVVVQRKGNTMMLWVDAILHGKLKNVPKYTSNPTMNIMYLMGSKPGNLNVSGQICKVARYDYALSEYQIKARYSYAIIYKIRGQITLQGVPTKATIRVFKHSTGELISEIESDANTGNYSLSLLNNSKIDLMVFNKNDRSVRYRAYGPITPSEYEDLPILV
jgi:hypothetical protein